MMRMGIVKEGMNRGFKGEENLEKGRESRQIGREIDRHDLWLQRFLEAAMERLFSPQEERIVETERNERWRRGVVCIRYCVVIVMIMEMMVIVTMMVMVTVLMMAATMVMEPMVKEVSLQIACQSRRLDHLRLLTPRS